MAKNYIFGPTELEFSKKGNILRSTLADKTIDELKTLIPLGSIIDINNGDKFVATAYNSKGDCLFLRNDVVYDPNNPADEFTNVGVDITGIFVSLKSTITASPGTYTVSIYTEGPDYPVKNTSYELHGHSDVERIRYKLKKKAEKEGWTG